MQAAERRELLAKGLSRLTEAVDAYKLAPVDRMRILQIKS